MDIIKGNVEITRKPRRRKLYGHVIEDMTLRIGPKKVDGRKLPHRHGMGHPYYKAMIGIFDDKELYWQFRNILKGLVYRERMALARAFGVHYNTILNWTKSKTSPETAILIQVIQWDKAGKPVEKVRPGIDDDRLAICPNMVSELTRCFHPSQPQQDMPLIKSLIVSNYYKQQHEQSLKTQQPFADLLRKERTYNPFDEKPFPSDELQDSGWPYPE